MSSTRQLQRLIADLHAGLATSNAASRKIWAETIVSQNIPLHQLFSLLHADPKTAQRMTWLIGDLCQIAPDVVAPCLPTLLQLNDQMPFPGMRRSLAKWLWHTNVPEPVAEEATELLFNWLSDKDGCIASKSFAAKALSDLVHQNRADSNRLKTVLQQQVLTPNLAFRKRLFKVLNQLGD